MVSFCQLFMNNTLVYKLWLWRKLNRVTLRIHNHSSNHCFVVPFAVGRLNCIGYLTSCDKYIYTNTLHLLTRLIFNTNKIWETFSRQIFVTSYLWLLYFLSSYFYLFLKLSRVKLSVSIIKRLVIAYMIEKTRIGHFEKYHNILKILVWVVPHVNVTLGLSFAHDLHGLSKICILDLFARTFRQRWPKYTFNITLSFITFRS